MYPVVPVIIDRASPVGSPAGGAKVTVPNTWNLTGEGTPNRFTNGVGPHAPDIRQLGDYLNFLAARRPRVLFRKHVMFRYTTASSTDNPTLRFACHTGPLAAKVRVAYTLYPASSRAASDSYAYWVSEQMEDDGTLVATTTQDRIYSTATYTANAADNFSSATQEFDVEPDANYGFTLHQVNAFAVAAVTVYEVPRLVLDTSADSPVVDVTRIAQLAPITTTTMQQLLDVGAKVAARCGHPLVCWTVDTRTPSAQSGGVNIDTTTQTNILDGTTSASATTLGWPVKVPYSGDPTNSDVYVTGWAHGTSEVSNFGAVEFRDQDGNVLGTLTFGSSDWVMDQFTIPEETTRIEIYAKSTSVGGGVGTLYLHAAGLFMYRA